MNLKRSKKAHRAERKRKNSLPAGDMKNTKYLQRKSVTIKLNS